MIQITKLDFGKRLQIGIGIKEKHICAHNDILFYTISQKSGSKAKLIAILNSHFGAKVILKPIVKSISISTSTDCSFTEGTYSKC